jgi:hypothetical protein
MFVKSTGLRLPFLCCFVSFCEEAIPTVASPVLFTEDNEVNEGLFPGVTPFTCGLACLLSREEAQKT